MRLLLALALATAPLLAEPHVRWLDSTGGYHDEKITEVLAATPALVKVRLVSGEERSIEGRGLIELSREDESDPDQRRLLFARLAVMAGETGEEWRVLLDELSSRKNWMGEQALAMRTMLAARAGEEGSGERIDAFERAHPASRFLCELEIARAFLESAKADEIEGILRPFDDAAARIDERGGPAILQWQALFETAPIIQRTKLVTMQQFLSAFDSRCNETAVRKGDAILTVVGESYRRWARLLIARDWRERRDDPDYRPVAPRATMGRLRDASSVLLPEVRSDIEFELGIIQAALGDREEALATFAGAARLAPDARRAAAIAAALRDLRDAK